MEFGRHKDAVILQVHITGAKLCFFVQKIQILTTLAIPKVRWERIW